MRAKPGKVFSPGEYLLDELCARNLSIPDFAKQIGKPYQAVNDVILGGTRINELWAALLSEAFGTSKIVWLRLQEQFDAFSD